MAMTPIRLRDFVEGDVVQIGGDSVGTVFAQSHQTGTTIVDVDGVRKSYPSDRVVGFKQAGRIKDEKPVRGDGRKFD